MSSEITFSTAAAAVTGAVVSGGASQAGVAAAEPLPHAAATPSVHRTDAAPDVLQRAAQRVVDAMQNGGNSFQFSIDKQSGMTIVRVFNKATGELVRQIPTEEIVHVAQLLSQDEQRALLDVRA